MLSQCGRTQLSALVRIVSLLAIAIVPFTAVGCGAIPFYTGPVSEEPKTIARNVMDFYVSSDEEAKARFKVLPQADEVALQGCRGAKIVDAVEQPRASNADVARVDVSFDRTCVDGGRVSQVQMTLQRRSGKWWPDRLSY